VLQAANEHAKEEQIVSRRVSFNSIPARTPIDLSPFHVFPTTRDIEIYMQAQARGELDSKLEYGRYGNTTRSAVETELLRIELGRDSLNSAVLFDALLVADGMRAITATFSALLAGAFNRFGAAKPHIIVGAECYKKTRQYCETRLRPYGVEVTVLQTAEYASIADHIRPETCFVFAEVPTNPYLRVVDIEAIAQVTKKKGIPLVVDSTFASPVNLRPLELGANLVLHSATKYLNGTNNLMAGVVLGERRYLDLVRDTIGIEGGILDSAAAARLDDGLKTLELRVGEQNRRALAVAEFLERQSPLIERVHYPFLPSHPDFAIASRIMDGGGSVISFEIRGGYSETLQFLDYLKLFQKSASFGGVTSLIQPVVLMSYSQMPKAERERIGIKDNLVRLSVGTAEHFDDLIADLTEALNRYAWQFRLNRKIREEAHV
jgi:cystathionine gamma-synthase